MNKTAEQRLEQVLRQKFVIISFSVVCAVLLSVSVVANGFTYLQIQWKADELTNIIAENDGVFPLPENPESSENPQRSQGQIGDEAPTPPQNPQQDLAERPAEPMPMNPEEEDPNRPPSQWEREERDPVFGEMHPRIPDEAPFTTRYFTLLYNNENEITHVDTANVQRVTPMEAQNFALSVMAEGKEIGTLEEFHYRKFYVENGEYLLIFVDISQDLYLFHSFCYTSILMVVVTMLGVLSLLIVFSRKAVAPIVESYAKQKTFITDMSHELKTPLAIVKTNTEVMEMEHGTSQWSASTHKQIEKLTMLVNRLLSLAKLEESAKGSPREFDFSLMLRETGESMEDFAQLQGKTLEIDIESKILYTGDPQGLRHLLDILLDNALKYSSPESKIILSLKKERNRIHLTVTNAGENLKKGSYHQWFQRFYREESSRNSETGGFGLGLSMAKTITRQHDGKITAFSPDGNIVQIKVELEHRESKKSKKSAENPTPNKNTEQI